MKKSFALAAVIFLCLTVNAYAMTGAEFFGKSPSEKVDLLEPLIVSYVQNGYKKVPHSFDFVVEMDNLIREKGYGSKNISEIALEAATKLGMAH